MITEQEYKERQGKMNEKELIERASELIKEVNTPYGNWTYTKIESLKSEVEAWLIHPDNDCLRARGDWRYTALSLLHLQLKSALEGW